MNKCVPGVNPGPLPPCFPRKVLQVLYGLQPVGTGIRFPGSHQSQVLWYLGRPFQIEKDLILSEMY